MKQIVPAATTSYRVALYAQDSTNKVGGGLTSLLYNSSGLTAYYYTNTNGTSSAISLVNETLGTWTSGGLIAVDTTNMPGVYEFGVPNACFAAGVEWSVIILQGAANMVPVTLEFEISSNVGTLTATVPTLSTNVNVQQWLGTAVTSSAGVPVVYTTNTVPANVVQWLGTAVTSNAGVPVTTNTGTCTATVPSLSTNVNVQQWLGTAVTSNAGTPIVYATNTQPANVVQWLGTAVTSAGGVPITTNTGTVTATVPAFTTNVNVTEWNGHNVASPNVNGVPIVDVGDWLGTAVTSNAGTPIVYTTNTVPANVVTWLGTAVTSNAGVPLVDVNGITGTVTATVVGGTISTVTGPVTLSTGQLTVKRNTALSGFTFPMYNGTTGNLQTGLTVSCMLSIDGGTLQASTNNPVEIGNGIYKLNLAAVDLNGTTIILVFTATNATATVISLITQA